MFEFFKVSRCSPPSSTNRSLTPCKKQQVLTLFFCTLHLSSNNLFTVSCKSLIRTVRADFQRANSSTIKLELVVWNEVGVFSLFFYLEARNLLLHTSHCPDNHSVCSWWDVKWFAELSKARASCSLSSVRCWTRLSKSSPTAATSRVFSSLFT